jgi:G3E family GTPase
MSNGSRIPVSVLTGFLGSGKTTLLNRVLKDANWSDTAVIVNELGEIALDHLLIESASDNIQVLSSGCLCCTLQGDLRVTLADLFVRRVNGKVPRFQRVIVETTGLADPGPVANAVVSDALLRSEYRFSAIATTVDAMQGAEQLQQYVEARRQASLADLIIVTKTDLVDANSRERLVQELGRLNPVAQVTASDHGQIDPALLFPRSEVSLRRAVGPSQRRLPGGAGLQAAHHTPDTAAWSFVIEHPVHWSGLAAWMAYAAENFGERLLRVKGIFTIAGESGVVAIHGIGRFFHPPERLDQPLSNGGISRLVCITRDLPEAEIARSLALLEEETSTHGI